MYVYIYIYIYIYTMTQEPQWAKTSTLSRIHDNSSHPVELLKNDQLDAETSTTQNSQEINIHAPAGFEPAIPASECSQTHALNRMVTGIDIL